MHFKGGHSGTMREIDTGRQKNERLSSRKTSGAWILKFTKQNQTKMGSNLQIQRFCFSNEWNNSLISSWSISNHKKERIELTYMPLSSWRIIISLEFPFGLSNLKMVWQISDYIEVNAASKEFMRTKYGKINGKTELSAKPHTGCTQQKIYEFSQSSQKVDREKNPVAHKILQSSLARMAQD